MSLATRCTACGTIFRVVQDQLRVSEGWVRCGRCAEVFDAREQLFDIDREAPPPWPATPSQAADAYVEVPPSPPPPPPPASPVWTSAPTPVSPPLHQPPAPPPPMSAPAFSATREDEMQPSRTDDAFFDTPHAPDPAPHSRLEPQWVDEPAPQPDEFAAAASSPRLAEAAKTPAFIEPARQDFGTDTILAPSIAEAAQEAAAAVSDGKPDKAAKKKKAGKPQSATKPAKTAPAEGENASSIPMPEFMRRAQQNERWRRPRVRIALGVCVALLGGLLAYQLVLQFHNAIVAVYPQARPAMQTFCELSGCELQPWRRIDVVGVEASALNQAGPNNQYQLTVNLRNKSGLEVATPWVELSLTDAAGAVVSRRMLAPTDFKTGKASMPPGAEMPLQVLLSTGKQRVSGYTVEIFHP